MENKKQDALEKLGWTKEVIGQFFTRYKQLENSIEINTRWQQVEITIEGTLVFPEFFALAEIIKSKENGK